MPSPRILENERLGTGRTIAVTATVAQLKEGARAIGHVEFGVEISVRTSAAQGEKENKSSAGRHVIPSGILSMSGMIRVQRVTSSIMKIPR